MEVRSLRKTLIFMLTTSDDERDIEMAYLNNVAGYIVKARAGHMFLDLMTTLDNYWRVVEIPEI